VLATMAATTLHTVTSTERPQLSQRIRGDTTSGVLQSTEAPE